MSISNWTIFKKLNTLMVLACVSSVCFFVLFYKSYVYLSVYDRVLAAVAMILALLFIVIVIVWLRHAVDYLRLLNDELQTLEGGDLNREITIRGSDELGMLAESVDCFRKSMKEDLSTIEELEKKNRQMSAEIAHDLRTPLTALIMYLDFALSELADREQLVAEYVTKARERSVRLKVLMDENFNYSTLPDYFLAEKQEIQAYEVLSAYLGDMMAYLEGEGFTVRQDTVYGHSSILIPRGKEGLGRVFSNLASNIMKYATKEEEVLIMCREKETHVEVRITNHVRTFEEEKPESTGFGERIVKRLMEEMDGEYFTEESDGKYTAVLRFAKV